MAIKRYDKDYKVQAVKLINEVGMTKTANELGVSPSTNAGLGQCGQAWNARPW